MKKLGTALAVATLSLSAGLGVETAWAAGPRPSASMLTGMPLASRLEGGSCTAGASSSHQPAFAASSGSFASAIGGLRVSCAIPYRDRKGDDRDERGEDCAAWHTVKYATAGASANAKVTAELVAYDTNGIVLKTVAVKDGDSAFLQSRVPPKPSPKGKGKGKDDDDDEYDLYKIKSNLKKRTFEMTAPVPVLRVTVEDNGERTTAYCSPVPWFEVIAPQGDVVTDEPAGNVTNVVLAATRIDPNSLSLTVDGVDILAAPTAPAVSACTAATPCDPFIVDIGGTPVTVSNLVVDIAPYFKLMASNTITFTLENQACGAHVYLLEGDPPYRKHHKGGKKGHHYGYGYGDWDEDDYYGSKNRCYRDDGVEKTASSIFGVTLTSPLAGDRLPAPPTHVTGQACSGREITKLTLNGKLQDLASQTCTVVDADTGAGTCIVPIDDTLVETDLENDLVNGALPLGTLDRGANTLVAAAQDDLGNRAFERVTFVTGATAAPGIELQSLLQQSAVDMAVQSQLKAAVMPQLMDALDATSVDIENAFVVGITAQATQELFTKLCSAPLPALKADGTPNDAALVGLTPGQIFQKRAKESLLGKFTTKTVGVGCAPDVDVKSTVTDVTVSDQVSCTVSFQQDKFHVTLALPDISVDLHAFGTSGGWGADICGLGAKVEGSFSASITDVKLDFDVTESQLMGNAPTPPTFNAGTTATAQGSVSADYCGLSDVCAFFVTVGTFGIVNLLDAEFDFNWSQDFDKELAGAEPDPVQLQNIKVDEATVQNYDQKLSGALSSVEIDTTGIRAGLKGTFTTTALDPEVDPTLGGVLTPNANIPTFTQAQAKDVFIGLSDDTVNMLFASMTAAGKLKGECTDTGKTVGSLLDLNKDTATNAADCDTITVDTGKPVQDALTTAMSRGLCYGVIRGNCEAINLNPGNPNDLNTATAQGVCHAIKQDDCNALTLAAGPLAASTEKALCTNTPNPNIYADQKLLFCARQELPPRMLFSDNTATPNAVEATLRMNDLSVALVLDRNNAGNTGTPDGAISTPLGEVPGCFASGNPTNNDCNLFATCLDVSVDFSVEKATSQCPADKPGFVNRFTKLEYSQERGYICGAGGTTAGTDSSIIENAQTDDTVTLDLTAAAQNAAPPICGAGLNLGLFGACGNASIFAADVSPAGTLKDFIGLTCALQP